MKKYAIALFLFAQLADFVTTALPGGYEGNPFARDANYHPLLVHLLVLKLLFYGTELLIGLVIYKHLTKLSIYLADCVAIGALLFSSYHTLHVAISNLLVYLNWKNP